MIQEGIEMATRTMPPKIKDPIEFDVHLPPCALHTLSNGVQVYAVNMGTEDMLMFNWVFFAGNCFEHKQALAASTNSMLKNGTSRLSAFDLNEHFEYYGAYLNRNCYNETSEISLHCLSKHVDQVLPVVAEIITDSVFPTKELEIYKQNSKQRLKVALQKSEFVAGRLIDQYLFGPNHPYGKASKLEDYDALQREELLQYFEQYYRNGRCVLFIAGKLPPDIIGTLEKHFGGLPLRGHQSDGQPIAYDFSPANEKKFRVINDEQGVQAAIRVARHFPNRHHPDFKKVMVLNNLFGGFFGSRLMTNIREDKGYTYGIYSYLLNHVHQSGWMISTEAGRDVSEATINEVYNEMNDIREEPVDEDELRMTQNYMIGTMLGDLDGAFQVAARWKNLILNGLDEQYFHDSIRTIKTITAEELQELAVKYLKPEDFFELVVI